MLFLSALSLSSLSIVTIYCASTSSGTTCLIVSISSSLSFTSSLYLSTSGFGLLSSVKIGLGVPFLSRTLGACMMPFIAAAASPMVLSLINLILTESTGNGMTSYRETPGN